MSEKTTDWLPIFGGWLRNIENEGMPTNNGQWPVSANPSGNGETRAGSREPDETIEALSMNVLRLA